MTIILDHLFNWLTPGPTFRRYRVTPRRNLSAFRRELLGCIMHNLNRDSTGTAHG
jgi:hypothetical protein